MSYAGIINVELANPEIISTITTDAGTFTGSSNNANLLGGEGIDVSGTGSTGTISAKLATSGATLAAANRGVCAFDSTDFTVVDGFVQVNSNFGGVVGIVSDDGLPAVNANGIGNLYITGNNGVATSSDVANNKEIISGINASTIAKGVVTLASGAETITGADSSKVVTPAGLKGKLGAQTDHGVLVGSGQTTAITAIIPATQGQLLTGISFADPVFASTAYGDFSFTNFSTAATPRTLSVVNLDTDVASTAEMRSSVPAGNGDPCFTWEVQATGFYSAGVDNSEAGDPWKLSNSSSPSGGDALLTVSNAGVVTINEAYALPTADGAADTVLTTDGAGSVSWQPVAVGLTYSEITDANKTIVMGESYGANRAGGVAFALPAAATVGDEFEVVGIAGLWSISQGDGQYIAGGAVSSTVGAGGSLTATNAGDCIQVKCIVTDVGFRVKSSFGNPNYV